MSQSSRSHARERLWTVDYALNLLTGHFLFASYTSMFTIIPPYVQHLGGEEWHIGVLVGSFGVVSLGVRPFAGRWIHRLGAKRVALAGTSIFALGSILHIAAAGVWWLVPVRMLQGIGLAIGPVATTTMVANLAPATRRGEGLAYMGNAIGIAGLYSPVVGFWLLTDHGFPVAFLYAALCGLVGSVMALRISSARTALPASEAARGSVPLVSRAALLPTAVFLSYTITTAPVASFLPLLAEDRHLGNPGLYFTVNSLTMIFTLLLSGHLADRVGRAAVIAPGLLITAASMFVLTTASNQAVFLGCAFMAGVGFGLLQPGIQSLTVDRSPPRERSSALATLQSAWDIGGAGGAFVLGPVAGAMSVAATFAITGAATVVGAAGFLVGIARSPAVLPRTQDAPSPREGQQP